MRILRISFTTTEADAGGVLADLAGRVSALDFNVVEQLPLPRKGPLLLSGPSKVKKSTIPICFKRSALYKQEKVSVMQIKGMLKDADMSPASYSHAINVLILADCIRATHERGVYAVIN